MRARVNIGDTKPPAKKLHAPNYDKKNLELLQDKFDELDSQGVFVRPEDVGVVVEHVSPSFLVRKPSGGHRLVTAFTSIGQYCKTLPTSMPTVDDTLRTIASWKYMVKTDLRDSFYQIPLERSSMKWCGTQTPFRGLRLYAVSAQGMPGSSETLEEMMSTVLGHLVREGCVVKIADDLYVGSTTSIDDLLSNWQRVLIAMRQNGLKLKSPKTHVGPTQTQVLGWNWNEGTISACAHKLTPLATCDPPSTTTAMRSFIGAYKVFNRVIRGCSNYLSDLENAIAGKQKTDKINWTDSLTSVFRKAQTALSATSTIMIPKPSDQLIITHDGSKIGIGSVLFVKRGEHLHLGGYFSAKTKSHHQRWLPCELEALSIATSINHFAPYIRESNHTTQILTDSKPCVQAWSKMTRGEFSTSARIATFLSALSQFDIELHFISGENNLPSDFHSRNPQSCDAPSSCQICSFIADSIDAAVRSVSVDEILSGQAQVPFNNRNAWKTHQLECPDLRRVHAHLSKGTKPSAKHSNLTAVKRYLNDLVISRDGLLVVIHSEPYMPRRELIVVPQHLIHGLLTSMHLKLNHPTAFQLQKVFARSFYAQNSQKHISTIIGNCHTCQSLKSVPKELHEQSSTDFPDVPCKSFAADVIKRHSQSIFAMRDTFSSFTTASLIPDETGAVLKDILIPSVSLLRPNPQTAVTVRVDNAPGFRTLRSDLDLSKLQISLDFGRVHNKNKNPVIDKGISELISEILRFCPEGGKLTPVSLAFAVNQLNSRIRNRGLSAWEILLKRDQSSMEALDLSDSSLSQSQRNIREKNQQSSAKSKARGGDVAVPLMVDPGCLVYLKSDGDKTKARDRYIVTSVNGDFCTIQNITKSLRNTKYCVKRAEVFPVLPTTHIRDDWSRGLDVQNDEAEEDEPTISDVSHANFDPAPTQLPVIDDVSEELPVSVNSPLTSGDPTSDDSANQPIQPPLEHTSTEEVAQEEAPPEECLREGVRPRSKRHMPKRYEDYVLY